MLKHSRKRYCILSLLLLGVVGQVQATYVVLDSMLLSNGTFNAEIQPYVVTSESPVNGPGNHAIAAPGASVLGGVNGVPAGGINHDGVGQLSVNTTAGMGLCTGTLLSSGQHILTAAHCLTNTTGATDVNSGQMYFDLPGGVISYPFGPADISVHPSYNGFVAAGYDVAVIDLNTTVPASVPRYDIVAPAPFTAPILGSKFGFGEGGHGSAGATLPMSTSAPGTKRFSQNVYEADGLEAIGVTNTDTQLTYDFDNGLVGNDAFGVFGTALGEGGADLGLGNGIEGNAALGDSGGPTFVYQGGTPKIAGITSYGISLTLTADTGTVITSDSVPGTNASFGEFSVDARLGNQSVNDFISNASAVPEPNAFLLVSLVMLVLGYCRRVNTVFAK